MEIRTYTSEQGVVQQVERVQLCQNARGNVTCGDVRRREYHARLEERKPDNTEDNDDNTIIRVNRDGREVEYRRVRRADEKRPVRSPTLPVRRSSIRPPAPSPPPPRRSTLVFDSDTCPRTDCPMSRDLEDISPRSPSYNDFLQQLGTRKTEVRIPSDIGNYAPKLATPPPPRRKILKPDHKRQDSAKGFGPRREDPMEGPSEPRRVRIEDSYDDRALAVELNRLSLSEARRREAQLNAEAEQAALDQARYQARDEARRLTSSVEAARRKKDAADDARRKARQVQQDVETEALYVKRQRGEEKAREEERRDAEQRQARERDALAGPSSPSTRRRPQPRAVVHYDTPGDVTIRDSQHLRTASDNIIIREQLRMEAEGRNAERRMSMDDPLRDVPLSIDERGVSEWAVNETESRKARMRRYREDERRRLGRE